MLHEGDKVWDEETLAYAAGFLDGEGCFTIDHGRKIRVSCANTNRPIIEWLHRTFGGSFCRNATRRRKPNHRRCFSWSVVSRDAAELCKSLSPYLREKSPQALLLIAFQQTMGKPGRHVSPDIKEERERLNSLLKGYKHVSWD